MERLSEFVKRRRKQTAMSQQEFAERAGVALTVLRKIEQNKNGLQLEKVNQVLKMFGHELAPVSSRELNTKRTNTTMRKANVLYNEKVAGTLTETDDGEYIFQYDKQYLEWKGSEPITLTMKLTERPYVADRLFAFFEGLIPEGWLLDIASKNWKLNPNDRMGLLLACCQNCIGAVSIKPIETENE